MCITNSSAEDSETEKSWFEDNSKSDNNATSKTVQFKSEQIQQKITEKTSKQRCLMNVGSGSAMSFNEMSDIRTAKKDLKVSHYSKNVFEPRGNQTRPSEISKNTETFIKKTMKPRKPPICENRFPMNGLGNHVNAENSTNILDPMCQQFSSSRDIQRTLPRLPIEVSQMSHHHVVDVVPKPAKTPFSSDYNVPDQTIGIPISDLIPYRDPQNVIQPSVHRPSFKFGSNFANVQPHTTNVLHNIPHIIHHPLISGNIPPSFHPANDNYSIKKKITSETLVASPPPKPPGTSRQYFNISSSILCATAQQTPFMKKENGEKNKVKFSNTVTVAVVPVSEFFHFFNTCVGSNRYEKMISTFFFHSHRLSYFYLIVSYFRTFHEKKDLRMIVRSAAFQAEMS